MKFQHQVWIFKAEFQRHQINLILTRVPNTNDVAKKTKITDLENKILDPMKWKYQTVQKKKTDNDWDIENTQNGTGN